MTRHKITAQDLDPQRTLADYIEEKRNEQFVYGLNDCCQFVREGVERVTGKPIDTSDIGKYSTVKEALRVLKKQGGFESLGKKYFGDPIEPTYAQRGDIVLFNYKDVEAVGLCVGDKIACLDKDGVVFIDLLENAKLAWRIK